MKIEFTYKLKFIPNLVEMLILPVSKAKHSVMKLLKPLSSLITL